VVRLEGVIVILDLHRQGLPVSEIARQSGLDPLPRPERPYVAGDGTMPYCAAAPVEPPGNPRTARLPSSPNPGAA
jgi:hypothetical protein